MRECWPSSFWGAPCLAGGGGRNPVSLPAMTDESASSEAMFQASFESDFDYMVFHVHGDSFEVLGQAISQVMYKYPRDHDGACVDINYLDANSDYYRRHLDNVGKAEGLPEGAYHHLCRRPVARCSRHIGRADVVHIQCWSPISRATASDLLNAWGCPGLPPERPHPGSHPKAKPVAPGFGRPGSSVH